MRDDQMLNILQGFDSVEKKTLNESFVVECPPDMPTETGGDVSINITGDPDSMASIMQALAGIQGGSIKPMGMAMQDDPAIPGRDDVEGDTDLNAGAIGTALGGALGAGLGLATGQGAFGTTLGTLSGAAAGDSLTDKDVDDPTIPGRDDVEGDMDLQADVGQIATGALDALKGLGSQAADVIGQGATAAGDAIAKGAQAAGDAAANTDLGQRAIDAMGQASDWAAGKGAEIGTKIGNAVGGAVGGVKAGSVGAGAGAAMGGAKGAELGKLAGKVAPAAAAAGTGLAVGSKALGGTDDKKLRQSAEEMESEYSASTEPDEHYDDEGTMSNKMSGGINGPKKMYKAAQRGDNAMAVEMKSRLEAMLAEKKKPDANKNGIPDYAEDGKGKNDLKKKTDADKKTKSPVKEESKDLADMKAFLQRLL